MERGLESSGDQKPLFDLIPMKYNYNTLIYDYLQDTYIHQLPAESLNKQRVMAERKKYFPIPFNETSRNEGVKQNTGY